MTDIKEAKASFVLHDGVNEERPRMPYRANAELPSSVRNHLPPHAQDIYREAFNHAYAAHSGDPRREEAAHRIAWAAVKRSYEKVGGEWVARNG
jgi:cation transport regulator